jgi:hypothetical protein
LMPARLSAPMIFDAFSADATKSSLMLKQRHGAFQRRSGSVVNATGCASDVNHIVAKI